MFYETEMVIEGALTLDRISVEFVKESQIYQYIQEFL
jgi:hypothetical protein